MARGCTILFAVLMAFGLLVPGSARGGMVCLGHARADARELAATADLPCGLQRCAHDPALVRLHGDHHDEHCHCTDVPASGAPVVLTGRADDAPSSGGVPAPPSGWRVIIAGERRGTCGAARAPPWFDPACDQRLAAVASVRLTI
jgi:hypothetical protein